MKIRCAHCRKQIEKPAGHVNRARAEGLKLFCNRRCFGMSRRKHKTKAQRVEAKRLYDIEYRANNLAMLKAKKRAYHKRTYDPVKAAAHRQARMPYHIEYCRRPEYRVKKAVYDKKRRAAVYGDFAEAFQLTIDLNREIKGRMTTHEVKYQNGGTNKAQRRKRQAYQEERSRTTASRRSGHPAAHGW